MKQILTVYTGGTIGSAPDGEKRALNPTLAKRAIAANFSEGDSRYADLSARLFCDSEFSAELQTLSESMTPEKLGHIIRHIRSFDLSQYAGVIVLHGTDTLAYTAALFSLLFSNTPTPIMLVSGNRPPMDPKTNANANFRAAAELIMDGIAPNVYVPYQNTDTDRDTVQLHLAASLMQCQNYSENFYNASPCKVFTLKFASMPDLELLDACKKLSEERSTVYAKKLQKIDTVPQNRVLLLHPYTGLDYARISLRGFSAVMHGTYHSGTVCVERNKEGEPYSSRSILSLADRCREREIPLFLSPCKLDGEQYSSAYDAVRSGGAIPLGMTIEVAYAKALAAVAMKLSGKELTAFMQANVCGEWN